MKRAKRKRLRFSPELIEMAAREAILERTLEDVVDAACRIAKQVAATLPEPLAERIRLVNAMDPHLASEIEAYEEVAALLTTHAIAIARAEGLRLMEHPFPVYPQNGWKPEYR
jgi:hypothetical protein